MEYAPTDNQQQQPEFPQLDLGLTVLMFKQGDDPMDAINHMMSFLSAIVTSRYPTTNNQLRNWSNPRQQATINDGRDKVLLVQAQANGQILHEEELAFLANLGTTEVALMENLSHYGLDDLAEVYNLDNVANNMINQAMQAMPSFEQSNVVNHSETEITNALILSVIEQLKTQVVNCTKINLDNKSVNDTLTTKLERYKEQVKVLKEGQNVDLKSEDNVSNSCEQSVEIDRLKQPLSEHLKEKESLMQTVTLLKNDFKKEESRNINRDIALEKRINFQNPFYLKKAQQLGPKLYDGNVIKNTSAIVIPDSKETLMLAEESHFETRFVSQTELSAEQAFWSQNSMNSSDLIPSNRPTKVEVPKELPKVSMVNTSLKKLKHHLAGFDLVVKERTTTTAITEGSWGFEHTKACFRDEKILFVKALKDLFNTFDQYLISKLSEVQNVFHQMKQAVEQHRLELKTFEVKMNQVLNENERLLEQVINKDIINIIVNYSMDNTYVNVHECKKCLKHETELLNKKDFVEKEIYDKLFRSFTTLEKHCISLEVDTQLNQEIFKRDYSVSNQSAPSFDQYFELNELKTQSQEKDTVIKKLKERIKSLSENMNEDKVKKDIEEIETINIELDHRVSNLIAENEHLKKGLADNVVSKHTIDPEMLKIDVEYLNPRLLNNRSAHSDYLKHTQEEAVILREIVEQGKSQNPLNESLDSACKYTKQIQELLIIVGQTCPSINNSSEKLAAMTPKNKDKRVRFTEPVRSSGNTNTKTASSSNLVSNKPMLSSTRVKPSTSTSGSQPSGNTKKDKIQRTPSSTQKNKVEAHPRTVKSSLKNKNNVVEPKETSNVQHSKLNANSELLCVKCNGCILSDNHDLCVLDFINDVNAHNKSKSTFTIVGNACPLTRITTTAKVPLRKPIALESDTPKPVVVQIVLWYLDSGCSKHMTGDRSQLTNFVNKFFGTFKFGNDHVAKIWGYSDYQIGNVTISTVYYVEGLGHNLFSVGQFYDSNLEVAFRQHTCFIPRHGLVRGIPKLKFEKDHLCSACAMGKSKKKSHKPKFKDTNQEKLYLLHIDLCGPMRVASANGKKSKDKASDFIIKFLEMIQVWLQLPIKRIRTDNGTEFVNQTFREYYEKDILFQPLFDELLTPPPSVDHPAPQVIAPIAKVVAPEPDASTDSPSLTTVN
ncbi:integrase, catalytic region, zinc finger, CCHC-type containing protein [Tanacetum coccineum]